MLIINVRGTNGSGKSTVAHTLLKEYGFDPLKVNQPETQTPMIDLVHYADPKTGRHKIVEGHVIKPLKLILVGSYRTQCGGADGIPTQNLIKEAVAKAASMNHHVLFEGVIISTLFSGYRELSKVMRGAGHAYNWVYLGTPLEECLSRIQARNGGKPIKVDLVKDKIKAIESTRRKAVQAGETVYTIADSADVARLVKHWISQHEFGSIQDTEALGQGTGSDQAEEGGGAPEALDH